VVFVVESKQSAIRPITPNASKVQEIMKKQSKLSGTLILAMLTIALPSCGPQMPSSQPVTLTPASTVRPSVTPSSTLASTYTPTLEPTTSLASPTLAGGGPGKIVYVTCNYETVSEGDMIFERTDANTCEIYLMNADGSDPINLTDNNVLDADPAPSPDGTKIAYASGLGDNAEIYTMNVDGSNQTQITDNNDWDHEPAWSPDGTQLVFSTQRRNGPSEINTMNADGSDETILIQGETSEGQYYSPDWSPIGTQIVFVREGFDQFACQGCSEIFVMNVDGSNPTQITHNSWSQNPVWSLNGTKIAYESYIKSGDIGLLLINADGSGQTELANTEGWDSEPSLSADGGAIAFQSDRGQSFGGDFDIYVISTDGSGLKRLTDNQNSSSPAWLQIPRNPSIQHADCSSGWTRLAAGDQASVSQDSITPNRVRSGPGATDEIIMLLHPGSVMKLIEGPICTDGLIFWKVENSSIPGGVGWTAEGDGQEYWLEPYTP
jgi:Tol biopolymer transport system component